MTAVDKFIKRIQSRLSHKGVQFQGRTVPLWKCREFYEAHVPAGDKANPSDEQINLIVELLTAHCSDNLPPSETTGALEKAPAATQLAQSIEEETEAIAPSEEDNRGGGRVVEGEMGQGATSHTLPPQENSPMQNPAGIVARESGEGGLIPQGEVKQMVSQAFANQPQDFKDQVTEYALQHSFDNVRQVQEFLEQLRGMEFNLLVNTLNDHFHRRGSMLNLLEEVIEHQKNKDGEASQNFFDNFNSRMSAFQREMAVRLSKTGL